MATTDLTTSSFEQAVNGDGIVLVDFWAAWCGPCRSFAPVYERASEAHPEITFAKVDIDAEQQLAQELQITAVPTLMAFRDGVLLHAQPGALPPAALEQLISAVEQVDMDAVNAELAEHEHTA